MKSATYCCILTFITRHFNFWAIIWLAFFTTLSSSKADTVVYSQGVSPDSSFQHVSATIFQNAPNSNNGARADFGVGRARHGLPGSGLEGLGSIRGVLAFDLLGIPDGATINSVSLTLSIIIAETQGSPGSLNLHSISPTESVIEGSGIYPSGPDNGVTWNEASAGEPWTPGGSYLPAVLSSAPETAMGTITLPSSLDFTTAAQGALDANRPLQLLLIAPLGEMRTGDGQHVYGFHSDDAADPANRPILTVDFTLVPEPSTLLLLGLAAAGGLVRRGR